MATDTVVRIASISKTFTAIAVMQLWEEGLIDLDAPVGEYLRSYRLVATDSSFAPVTVRHLLTHTGGLGELSRPSDMFRPDFGESFGVESGPTLAEFYGGVLRVAAAPGTRWVYSNHGTATLGQIVEDVRRRPLRKCFQKHIFDPLGMVDTDLERSVAVETKLATGYEIGRRGLTAQRDRDMVTAGAAGVFSTAVDMGRYLVALTNGGRNEYGSILGAETLAMMFAPHYQPHPLIPGVGLGFWRHDVGGHLAVGHQGTISGFHSQILVAPGDGVAVMTFTNGATKPDLWLPSETERLLATELGVDRDATQTAPHRPEVWSDICGWYRLDAAASDVRLRGVLGAGVEVFMHRGRPVLRFLTAVPSLFRGFPLIPDSLTEPRAFRMELSDEGPTMRVVFDRAIDGRTDRLHMDLMPVSLLKRPETTNPRRWLAAGLAVTASALAVRAAPR